MRECSYKQAAAISLLLHVVAGIALSVAPFALSRFEPVSDVVPVRLLSMGEMGGMTAEAAAPVPPMPAPEPVLEETVAEPQPQPLPDTVDEPAVATLAPPAPQTGNPQAGQPGIGQGEGKGDGEGYGDGLGGSGENQARILEGTKPRYPMAARREGREGSVVVNILVGTDGRPETVTIRESSGFAELDEAALAAVKKWRFAPAMKDGQPIAGYHAVRIRFRLTDTD
ncbi:energy transducer TonB [Acetonema longum]|uniref:TonB family protein n=1 Tax=Acetonema longum DSM 6540 TaxID=1009370 RepID=F7NM63_9FIRM|nr:energy transducer TonB [Acetonema longum]EGO62864.1 TonB family protein [Acetonema longum DSM 6540]